MNQQYDILLEKYFSSTLSEKENTEFNNLLSKDSEFKRQFDLYSDLEKHVEINVKHEKQIKDLKSKIKKAHTKTKNSILKKYLLLISLASFLLIIAYFILSKNITKEPKYFAELNNHYQININTKSTQDIINSHKAFDLYNSKQYEKSIPLLKEVSDENKDDAKLAIALSYMYLNDFSSSKEILKSLESNILYRDIAYWYHAMMEFKLENPKQAKLALSKISSGSYYYKKAQEILQK